MIKWLYNLFFGYKEKSKINICDGDCFICTTHFNTLQRGYEYIFDNDTHAGELIEVIKSDIIAGIPVYYVAKMKDERCVRSCKYGIYSINSVYNYDFVFTENELLRYFKPISKDELIIKDILE